LNRNEVALRSPRGTLCGGRARPYHGGGQGSGDLGRGVGTRGLTTVVGGNQRVREKKNNVKVITARKQEMKTRRPTQKGENLGGLAIVCHTNIEGDAASVLGRGERAELKKAQM